MLKLYHRLRSRSRAAYQAAQEPNLVFSRRRKVLFALIAFVAGLALVEIGAHVVERRLARPKVVDARSPLAFQSLPDLSPLMRDHDTPEGHYVLVLPDQPDQLVPMTKGAREKRVVLIGGSWVQGMGVAPPATFAAILERLLNEAAGRGERVRVFNLARIGYASSQLAHVVEQVALPLSPDLVVTLTGNNEYLDFRAATGCSDRGLFRLSLARRLERRLAIARLLAPRHRAGGEAKPAAAPTPAIVTPVGDLRAYVHARLARSLARVHDAAVAAGARTLVCSVPVNERYGYTREWFFAGDSEAQPRPYRVARWALRYGAPDIAIREMTPLADSGEPAAIHVRALALDTAGRIDEAAAEYRRLRAALDTGARDGASFDARAYLTAAAINRLEGPRAVEAWMPAALAHLEKDESRATQHVLAGSILEFAGQRERAREEFARAPSADCIQADAGINQTLMTTAASLGAAHYDLLAGVREVSPNGVPGWDWFLDYCHLNVRGHILVAHRLASEIAGRLGLPGRIPPADARLSDEARRRNARPFDLPDLAWWAGADFDATILVDEVVIQNRKPLAQIAASPASKENPTLATLFAANWRASKTMGDVTMDRDAALSAYADVAASGDALADVAAGNAEFVRGALR
ncbi:hypothetical protein K8I61_14630 [bacterium]|nr:hypothetical protein [bacterium]